MTYPIHQVLQISGTLGAKASPVEIWSTSVKFIAQVDGPGGGGGVVSLTTEECEDLLDNHFLARVNALKDLPNLQTGGTSCHMTQVKFNNVDEDGHYTTNPTVARELPSVEFGNSVQPAKFPFQVAKVLTLETGYIRGAASRGRMYLPVPINALNPNTGLIDNPVTEVAAMAGWMATLETTITRGSDTIVVSPHVVSSIGNGFAFRKITGVSMNNVLDTQRRRTNDLTGTRTAADL